MPLWFETKRALTVEVRAPLPTHRDRAPSLADLERPGNEDDMAQRASPFRDSLEVLRLVLDLQDHLNLNAGAVGQRGHAHCGPGMGSGIAVELA
jgi:hypothetical protein